MIKSYINSKQAVKYYMKAVGSVMFSLFMVTNGINKAIKYIDKGNEIRRKMS